MELQRITTGIDGFDEILDGGLPKNHVYLLQGEAGSGKTTLSFQFLLEGVRQQEKVLYISILQSRADIEEMFVSHGWDISGIEIEVLVEEALQDSMTQHQTLLPSAEVQFNEVLKGVAEAVDRVQPARVVFDSIEQFRLIAGDPMLFQQKTMELKHLLDSSRATSIFIHTTEEKAGLRTLAHGVISMESSMPTMGGVLRYIRVDKMRNIAFREGLYSYRIRKGGLVIFPPMPTQQTREPPSYDTVTSGNDELDTLLGGGLQRGTSCLLSGASGTGKSIIATVFAHQAGLRGEHSTIFLFDEQKEVFKERAKNLGMDLSGLIESKTISLKQVDVGGLSAGELGLRMRHAVEKNNAKIVVLDSISGFYNALQDEPQLLSHLHQMLSYLAEKDVLSLMVMTEHGIFNDVKSDIDVSYIADSVVLTRRFEAAGSIRLAISAIKKRIGTHEKTIRELQITTGGIKVGQPLHRFSGILTGQPRYIGKDEELMG